MRHLSTLPNELSYRFVGVFYDGSHRDCVVEIDAAGNFTVREWSELRGWLTEKEHRESVAMYREMFNRRLSYEAIGRAADAAYRSLVSKERAA